MYRDRRQRVIMPGGGAEAADVAGRESDGVGLNVPSRPAAPWMIGKPAIVSTLADAATPINFQPEQLRRTRGAPYSG